MEVVQSVEKPRYRKKKNIRIVTVPLRRLCMLLYRKRKTKVGMGILHCMYSSMLICLMLKDYRFPVVNEVSKYLPSCQWYCSCSCGFLRGLQLATSWMAVVSVRWSVFREGRWRLDDLCFEPPCDPHVCVTPCDPHVCVTSAFGVEKTWRSEWVSSWYRCYERCDVIVGILTFLKLSRMWVV